eukprot:NODE_79_length_22985_cov_0.358401.p1 type:complete len:794 gc:universal NODE_79_length_22985_cov_0.358401:20682-18301(-)
MLLTLVLSKQYIVELNASYKLPTSIKTVYKFKLSDTVVIDSSESILTLSSLKGVKNVWEDIVVDAPRPDIQIAYSNITVNNAIHELTGVSKLHESGHYGHGAKVGVVDTGIDYNHPAFGSCFKSPGCKVINGYDFTGDDGFTEDEYPMDNCNEHGTHVSGIVAGKDELFTGVAPQAELAVYKVFPCKGGARESIIMRAMELAYHDGMHVINLSLGSWSGWDNRPYCRLIDRLSELGLIVVISQGNEGADGLFMGGSPAISKSAISVASFNNKIFLNYQQLQSGESSISAEIVNEGTGKYNIAVSSPTEVSNDGCMPYSYKFNSDDAVLIKRGSCPLSDKINNAIKAGAGLVLLYNLSDGPFSTGYQDSSFAVGVYLLSGLDGQLLRVKKGTIAVTDKKSQQISTASGYPSDFSSWGPGSLLQLKPEAAGVGGAVFSSLPLDQGKYGILSGTSMSAPYISGVVALYIGLHGPVSSYRMKELLMNNGEISSNNGVYPVIKQGAGLVNATKVLFNPVSASPCKLELLDQKWYSLYKYKKISISNNDDKSVKFRVKHIPALSINGDKFGSVATKAAFSKVLVDRYITVKSKQSRSINVRIFPPWLSNYEKWIYSGYIQLIPVNNINAHPISVPYMGYKGSLKSASVLGNDGIFPNVITSGRLDDPFSGIHNATDVISADFTYNGTIVFQLRVLQPSPLLTIELYKDNKRIGYVYQQQALSRTYSSYDKDQAFKYLLQIPWVYGSCVACYSKSMDAGKVNWKSLEDGEYFVKIIVNKPFNDGKETWTSGKIYINRQEG